VQDKVLAPSLSYLSKLYLSLQPMKTSCLVSPEVYRHIDHPDVTEGLQQLLRQECLSLGSRLFINHIRANWYLIQYCFHLNYLNFPQFNVPRNLAFLCRQTHQSMDHVRRARWCCVPACSIYTVIFVDISVLAIHAFHRIVIGDTPSFKSTASLYCCCPSRS
jgi:hypothetical protein